MIVLSNCFTMGTNIFISATIAAVAQHHHHVFLLYHAKVAMNGIGCMHKQGRCTGRVECSNNFLGYNGAFANTADHHSAFAGMYQLNCFLKI